MNAGFFERAAVEAEARYRVEEAAIDRLLRMLNAAADSLDAMADEWAAECRATGVSS